MVQELFSTINRSKMVALEKTSERDHMIRSVKLLLIFVRGKAPEPPIGEWIEVPQSVVSISEGIIVGHTRPDNWTERTQISAHPMVI